ncbi:MAG: heme A synthase [Acidobacteria bacterium]|nr:MAG: heme A synthase [Acidobacteriota bacterium]
MVDRRLDLFQKLALATTATTYLLILVGGLVRAAGAGLGCPDWPKCFGSWVPPTRADQLPPAFDPAQFNAALAWTEYLNRLLGVVVGFLIFATLAAAVAGHRRAPRVLWPTLFAFLLVGFQGWLGGRVVAHGLEPWIVTAHLVVALVIVSLLLYATVNAFFPSAAPAPSPGRRRLGRAAGALLALTLAQVAVGTQVRSRIDEAARADRLPRAAWLASAGGVDMAHRKTSLAVLAGALTLLVVTWRRERAPGWLVGAAAAAAGLTLVQITVGVVLAYLDLPRGAQVAHLAVASLLLGAETLVALLAYRLPEGAA